MAAAKAVKTSVTNSLSQDYTNLDNLPSSTCKQNIARQFARGVLVLCNASKTCCGIVAKNLSRLRVTLAATKMLQDLMIASMLHHVTCRTTCIATKLRDKLHEKLHSVTPPLSRFPVGCFPVGCFPGVFSVFLSYNRQSHGFVKLYMSSSLKSG